ncbi:MAG: phosphoglycolate phosphatase [Spongiibacter sp.]|uniref:Phosphoglycolate phosphatase n=1 Tax=Spongiibacter thalassae TaxID=2721624 RepID=A0ABX1GBV5_9GAMM|nr:phosphoglycolate phosphatase [Spongiibacter thalassae]NKI16630.1 phosphoglycolate phosphatase [Spongiibacter thalassae]
MSRLAALRAPHTLRGILFDLDGTLVDSVPDLAWALDEALLACGFAAAGVERVRGWVGNGAAKLAQRATAWALSVAEEAAPEHEVQRVLESFYDFYASDSSSRSQLYPGVREALAHWSQLGLKLACVTNKPERFTHPILREFAIDQYMPVVVGGDTLPQRKPDPAPLQHACELMGLAPENVVMVGDSANDVGAARAIAMPVACVSYGYNHGEPVSAAQPDILVDHFADLV